MNASLPAPDPRHPGPVDGGQIVRVPSPPPGVAPATREVARTADPIPPPPALFAEPAPQAPESPRIVAPVQIALPQPASQAEATADRAGGSWQLAIQGGRTFQLSRPRVLLGRDPVGRSGEQEIVIHDPTRTVSKTHALLELVADVWRVTDLGSLNGVILFRPEEEKLLDPGTPEPVTRLFALGQVVIAVTRSSDEEPSEPGAPDN